MRHALIALLALFVAAPAFAGPADDVKTATWKHNGAACTAPGFNAMELVVRGEDCSMEASICEAVTFPAIGENSGDTAAAAAAALAADCIVVGITVSSLGNSITAKAVNNDFDVCVEGVKILSESGIGSTSICDTQVAIGVNKKKKAVPSLTGLGLVMLSMVMMGGAFFVLRRRAAAPTA